MASVILFNINIFKLQNIISLCKDLKIATHVATRDDLSKTIGQIAGLPALNVNKGSPVDFHDEMMVFCGMDSDLLDRFLEEYRKREIGVVMLKAIMTPYNAKWFPGRLCMELKKEQVEFGG